MELDDLLHEKITELCKSGDDLIEKEQYDEAIVQYNFALDLVPYPKKDWEASTWIYSAIGDAFFMKEDYKNSSNCFYDALNCPDGIVNPFILLRLGQSLFELGDEKKAKEYLLKAYMIEEIQIFSNEDDKYKDLIMDII